MGYIPLKNTQAIYVDNLSNLIRIAQITLSFSGVIWPTNLPLFRGRCDLSRQNIQANAGKALQTVDFNAIAQKVGYANTALLFETYLDAVSQECANLTEPKWIKKLGGVDVWTKDHCYEVIKPSI